VRILSGYVLRQFLPSLAVSFLAFIGIFVIIDLVDRLSSFLDRDIGVSTVLLFYACYVPYITVLILPMAMLLASLFCMGTLIRNRELMAMKAVGLSLYRIVFPIQMLALAVSLITFFIAAYVVPGANRERARIETGEGPWGPRLMRSQVILRDVDDQILSMVSYYPQDRKGKQVTLDRYKNGILIEKVRAEEAVWEDMGWTFYRGERRFFRGEAEGVFKFEQLRPTGMTLIPEDLTRESRPVDQMRLDELEEFITRKVRNGVGAVRETVAWHLRMAFPFANFVIVLFGLPLAARIQGTARPLQIGVCLLASFVFYGSIQAGRAMGWNGVIPPFLGAWAANGFFSILGVILLVRTRK